MEEEINSKLKTLDKNEMVDYLLECLPFITELNEQSKSNVISVESFFPGVTKTIGAKKGDLYKRFTRKVNDKCEYTEDECIYQCKFCKSMNIIYMWNTYEQACGNCFAYDICYLDNDNIGFKEEQEMTKNIVYSYKRENHFNEWICQFQAKESTNVPEEIIERIKIELKKQKIKSKDDITHKKIKEILKKLKYNKYYEHTPYITTMVNGIKPPVMPQQLEDRLRIMFYQIQGPFDRFCPKDRINFLSYSYVLYKFCELLGEDEYLPCFPLLKSKEKLYKHDQIWKKITDELKWEFIPTI